MASDSEASPVNSSPPASDASQRRRKGRRKNPTLARLRRTWQDWWVEIVVAVLILLAIFLLVEQMNTRETLYAWLLAAVGGLDSFVTALATGLVAFVQGTTLSDLVAYVLILVVVVLIAWRARYRLLTNPRLAELCCPRCGGDLHRIHRRWYHRALSFVIPVRRYRCKEPACGWQGLRIKSSQ